MALKEYRTKRDFRRTPEPAGAARAPGRPGAGMFVVQKHAAARLHYDFRLELAGVLKSWAVPKGPSLDPAVKRLAVHVEDHPLEYGDFEGIIPPGEYGGGTVLLWDTGAWHAQGDPEVAYRRGRLKFRLDGDKLRGGWTLVRMERDRGEKENWLLIKERDEEARVGGEEILETRPESVATGRTIEEVASDADRVWRADAMEGGAAAAARPAKRRRAARLVAPDPSGIPGVRQGALPRTLSPQLATLVSAAPENDKWLHEIKFDGYRILVRIDGDDVRLISRRGKDWTDRFAAIAEAARLLPGDRAFVDGEVVAMNERGISDFQLLQNSLSSGGRALLFYAFDLLHLDGYDLTRAKLVDRKSTLEQLLAGLPSAGRIRFADHIVGRGPSFYAEACRMGLEGIISKRADQPYRSTRTRDWLKVKCTLRQEFVVVGYTEPSGSRTGFGALLLAVHDQAGRLVYAGKVGTGFTTRTLTELHRQLRELERDDSPLVDRPRGLSLRGVHWVEPRLVAEVAFTEWTGDGVIRHSSFQGLREDRSPDEVVREVPARPGALGEGHRAPGRDSRPAGRDPRAVAGEERRARRRGQRTSADAGRTARAQQEPPGSDQARRATERKRAEGRRRTAGDQAPSDAVMRIEGVRITHPNRVMYPEQGITKRALIEYYAAVMDWMLPHIAQRPLTLVRCPSGREEQCFFQKHATRSIPDIIPRVPVEEQDGTGIYLMIDAPAALFALVQLGVLEFHIGNARADRLDRPDRIVFDLDPDEGLPWRDTVATALLLRERLADLELESFVKTTGGKGLHVLVPLTRRNSWDEVRDVAERLAQEFVALEPRRFTATMSKARRKGRIFIDYFRNTRGATWIAPYSTRTRPGAPVSVPLAWDELTQSGNRPPRHTIRDVPERLASLRRDPWADIGRLRQSLTASIRRSVGG